MPKLKAIRALPAIAGQPIGQSNAVQLKLPPRIRVVKQSIETLCYGSEVIETL